MTAVAWHDSWRLAGVVPGVVPGVMPAGIVMRSDGARAAAQAIVCSSRQLAAASSLIFSYFFSFRLNSTSKPTTGKRTLALFL